jgi:hypothetical protein
MNPLLFGHEAKREGDGERGPWAPPGIRTSARAAVRSGPSQNLAAHGGHEGVVRL